LELKDSPLYLVKRSVETTYDIASVAAVLQTLVLPEIWRRRSGAAVVSSLLVYDSICRLVRTNQSFLFFPLWHIECHRRTDVFILTVRLHTHSKLSTRPVRKISSHFEYLENRSHGLDVRV